MELCSLTGASRCVAVAVSTVVVATAAAAAAAAMGVEDAAPCAPAVQVKPGVDAVEAQANGYFVAVDEAHRPWSLRREDNEGERGEWSLAIDNRFPEVGVDGLEANRWSLT